LSAPPSSSALTSISSRPSLGASGSSWKARSVNSTGSPVRIENIAAARSNRVAPMYDHGSVTSAKTKTFTTATLRDPESVVSPLYIRAMHHHDATGISWIEHGAGVPVVMLHGLMGDHRLISTFTESVLSSRPGLRRLHLDLPGHGRSSGDGVSSSDDVVERVAAFLDDVVAGQPYALVGNSFGGGVARALTARDPSRVLGLALIAPMIIADHARRDVPAHDPIVVDHDVIASAADDEDVRDFASFTFRLTRRHWELYVADAVPGARAADVKAIERISAAYEFSVSPESRFTTYDRPVTFILGRQDPVVGYADALALALAPAYPRATYVVADGAGHNPHHEQPQLSAAALGSWVDAVVSSTA